MPASEDDHWRWGFCYVNAGDDRILVPKRNVFLGWTFNFAHYESFVVTGALLGVAAVSVWLQKQSLRR